MSAASIQAALDAYLQTLPGIDLTQVAWPNVSFSSTTGVPYLAPKISALTQVNLGPGNHDVVQWKGTYQISCLQPANDGTANLLATVDAVRAIYKRGTTMVTTDGLSVIVELARTIPYQQDGEWLHAPVLVDFFSFEFP